MKTWETRYKGHTIRVENSFVERLFVDGELQDEHGTLGLRSRLHGKIRDGDGAGDAILVSLAASPQPDQQDDPEDHEAGWD